MMVSLGAMKTAVLGKHPETRGNTGGKGKEQQQQKKRDAVPYSLPVNSSSTSAASSTTTTRPAPQGASTSLEGGDGACGAMDRSTRDRRFGLMNRQVGSLNVWKAPVEGPALRYAKRCSRSPSPIPRRKVSFRLSASASSMPSLAETVNLSESFSSFDGTVLSRSIARGRARRSSLHDSLSTTNSQSSSAYSISSVKSSLKVPRQSVSISRTYDPALILLEDDEKRVKFSSVSIHVHSMTLGDNPAVSAGVPVQIDWKPLTSFTRPLDEYETTKDRPPRSVQQLRIGPIRRENILKDLGESRDDLVCVLRSISQIQASRAKNAGAVSVDSASSSSSSSSSSPSVRSDAAGYTNQRIRSGTALPKALQRLIVSKPSAQPA